MSSNPFDDPEGRFLVLVDGLGRYSLWPTFAPVPAGWRAVHGEDDRESCLRYVEEHWEGALPVADRS